MPKLQEWVPTKYCNLEECTLEEIIGVNALMREYAEREDTSVVLLQTSCFICGYPPENRYLIMSEKEGREMAQRLGRTSRAAVYVYSRSEVYTILRKALSN